MAKVVFVTELDIPDEILTEYLHLLTRGCLWLNPNELLGNKFQLWENREQMPTGEIVTVKSTVSMMEVI